jgi:hypothetical protein
MPCERMQAENASSACCIFARCCGDCWPPFGSTFWQACCAARNFGELGSIPEPGPIEIPPPLLGSGKFGTPCERMHAENCAAFAVFSVSPAPPPELELVDGPAAVPPPDEVVVPALDVPRLATEGDAEPPHPATSDARATSDSKASAMRAWRDRIIAASKPAVRETALKRL